MSSNIPNPKQQAVGSQEQTGSLRAMLEGQLRKEEEWDRIEHQLDKLSATMADEEQLFDSLSKSRTGSGGQEQEAGRPHQIQVKKNCKWAGLRIPPEETRTEAKLSINGGEEQPSEEEKATAEGSGARPPASEIQLESGAGAQPQVPNNRPEWGRHTVLEKILDCCSAQTGRWVEVSPATEKLIASGLDEILIRLGMQWLDDSGCSPSPWTSGDSRSQ
jgi:hypothetical protein